VGQVVVLLLYLDVAVGELLVLLFDLAVASLHFQEALLELPDAGVDGGRRTALHRGLEAGHLETKPLVLLEQLLREFLGLEEDSKEFLALLDGVVSAGHGASNEFYAELTEFAWR